MVFLFQSALQQKSSQSQLAAFQGEVQNAINMAFKTNGLPPVKRFLWDMGVEKTNNILGLKVIKPAVPELKIFISSYKTDKMTNTVPEMEKFIVKNANEIFKQNNSQERVGLNDISHSRKDGAVVYTLYLPPSAIPKK